MRWAWLPVAVIDVLGGDLASLLGRHQVAAALGHARERHDPLRAGPAVGVGLPAPGDLDAAAARAAGQRLGHVGRVDVAVGRVEDRADQILGAHQRVAPGDLPRGQPLEGHAAGLGGGGVEAVLVHPRLGLGHAQVAHHAEARVEPRLPLQGLVEADRVVVDVGRGVAHVEVGQQPRRVPGRAGGELVALHQQRVPARPAQRVGDPGAHRAPAHDQRPNMRPHARRPHLRPHLRPGRSVRHRGGRRTAQSTLPRPEATPPVRMAARPCRDAPSGPPGPGARRAPGGRTGAGPGAARPSVNGVESERTQRSQCVSPEGGRRRILQRSAGLRRNCQSAIAARGGRGVAAGPRGFPRRRG